MRRRNLIVVLGFLSSLLAASVLHADMNQDVIALQQRWAEVNYLLKGKSQVEAFSTLIEDARKVTEAQSNSAEAWIWSGIIRSSYAGAKGGLGALSSAKAAKADLEKGMELDADALDGSAYTSLGVLYLNVPGWPVGFGDEEKGVELLKKGLELSPDGIDSNYFYAEYLFKQDAYTEAERYLNRALNAPSRPGRELADEGRHGEIEAMLQEIDGAK
jgi:tetratricopeptide (TPR) repeat protein